MSLLSSSRLLARTSLRHLLRHPWQIGLCILGVALGVAMVVAIDLANASARGAFTLSTESVAGRATHQIVGGPSGLDEALYRRLRVELGLRAAAPVVEGYVAVPALGGATMQLLGVDPFAEAPFRSFFAAASGDRRGADTALAALIVEPATVLLAEQAAARYGIAPGSDMELLVGGQPRAVRVVGLLRPGDELSARALEGVLIADIATAQELLGMVGRLSRIDLILPEEQRTENREQGTGNGERGIASSDPCSLFPSTTLRAGSALCSVLPPGAQLTRPAARSVALEQMTRAFELNLSALSLLALIVGMFLIYNTVTFSVVQRRGLIGTLRCIGVSRRQVFWLVMVEAAAISLLGSLVGLLLGVALGRGLVGLVTQTINDLYFVVTVRSLAIDPLVLLKGLLLGIVATLAAAAMPAVEATLTPPRTVLRRSSIEERVRRAVPRTALAGLALIASGAAILVLPELQIADCTSQPGSILHSALCTLHSALAHLYVAFAGLFAIVLGSALLTPGLTVALMRLLRPPLGRAFGLLGRMAARDVVAALSRTSVAIAALMVAIGVAIGVGMMVGSFRQTVIGWLDQSLVADIYVSPPSNIANRVDTTVDPALVDELSRLPGIVSRTRFRNVDVDTPAGPALLVAVDGDLQRARRPIRFQAGGEESWQTFAAGGVQISEALAYRAGLAVGDTLTLRTDRGPQPFPIAAVYYDYSSDRGVIRMTYQTYRRFWDDPAISSFALYAAPGADVDTLVRQLRERAGGRQQLIISSNRGLRAGTLAVFDRTFAITAVLQLLATVVAFIGILSALMALQLERARELGMLRANGLTPRQLWGVVISQTGLMGLTAGLLALPVGLCLALVLIYVINRRSFGWTLDLNLEPSLFFQAVLVSLAAALLAGIYPALKMSRTSPAAALREE